MLAPPATLGLYVHFPWCVKKCPYCDFNSHELRQPIQESAYVDALIRDLDHDLPRLGQTTVSSIFMGGGTPSLFSPASVERLLQAIRRRLALSSDCEITLEANPGTAEADKFAGFRDAGVNRLSIGVQSFDDAHLGALGRIHDAAQAHRAIEMAQSAGFERINIDLMFGLPGQTITEAESDVAQALAYRTGHLSHYQLTLEKNTLFYKRPPTLPDDETLWAMQQACHERITEHYSHYEVSAFAAEGHAARHNLNYWRYGDYLGIGAGAHSKLTTPNGRILRFWKLKHPQHYLDSAGLVTCLGGIQTLPGTQLPFEFMMNALRLKHGFEPNLFEHRTGLPFTVVEPSLVQLQHRELIEFDQGTVRCTERGWNFLNDALEPFLEHAHLE